MKVVVILLVSVLGMMTSLHLTNAALAVERATDSDFPGMCLGRSSGIILAQGETRFLPHCQKVYCEQSDDGEMSLTYVSCGSVSGRGPPGCRITRDSTLDHPGCCPKFTCD